MDWTADCIGHLREQKLACIAPTPEAESETSTQWPLISIRCWGGNLAISGPFVRHQDLLLAESWGRDWNASFFLNDQNTQSCRLGHTARTLLLPFQNTTHVSRQSLLRYCSKTVSLHIFPERLNISSPFTDLGTDERGRPPCAEPPQQRSPVPLKPAAMRGYQDAPQFHNRIVQPESLVRYSSLAWSY